MNLSAREFASLPNAYTERLLYNYMFPIMRRNPQFKWQKTDLTNSYWLMSNEPTLFRLSLHQNCLYVQNQKKEK